MWANPQFPADLVTFTEEIFFVVIVKRPLWQRCFKNLQVVEKQLFAVVEVVEKL